MRPIVTPLFADGDYKLFRTNCLSVSTCIVLHDQIRRMGVRGKMAINWHCLNLDNFYLHRKDKITNCCCRKKNHFLGVRCLVNVSLLYTVTIRLPHRGDENKKKIMTTFFLMFINFTCSNISELLNRLSRFVFCSIYSGWRNFSLLGILSLGRLLLI